MHSVTLYATTCAHLYTYNIGNIPETLVVTLVSFYIYVYVYISFSILYFINSLIVCCYHKSISGINKVSLIPIQKRNVKELHQIEQNKLCT